MLYNDYGTTGIAVSRLGMGGMRFPEPHKTDEMAKIVIRAYERGITYFDTAPSYCENQSEVIYGAAFKEMKKGDHPFYVTSKTNATSPEEVRRDLETSLDRMGIEAIDFYHVWYLVRPGELEERKAAGVLDEFRKLREEGLIRHICVSTHLEHEHVDAMLEESEGLFRGMLIGLNATNFDLRYPGAQAAAKRDMAVVTMNTLAGGLIPQHPDHFAYIMREEDQSIVEAAIRFNLSLPEITVALVGFHSLEAVDEAADAVDRFRPLSTAEIEAHQKRLVAQSKDFCTQCGYCRDCPVDIPVVRLMDTWNLRSIEGADAVMSYLNWHWGIWNLEELLDSCVQCGQCEAACTQHLPILERFEALRQDWVRLKKA